MSKPRPKKSGAGVSGAAKKSAITPTYRARLHFLIGKDVLLGKTIPPEGFSSFQYALFYLLCGMEELADGMDQSFDDLATRIAAIDLGVGSPKEGGR